MVTPEGVIRNAHHGGSLRLVAGNANKAPLSRIGEKGLKKVEDLRGKRIGTTSLKEGTAIMVQKTSDPMVVSRAFPTAAISDALDQKTEERPACDLASQWDRLLSWELSCCSRLVARTAAPEAERDVALIQTTVIFTA